jgi:hypothetical protein
MNKPYAQRPPVISYAERPRFERSILTLPNDRRAALVATLNDHFEKRHIQSLQRRGQFLYLALSDDSGERLEIYDFGCQQTAQSCLTALTDCLRSQRLTVRVLMPEPPPAPSADAKAASAR